jgi:class 3 adenylate cyclase/HAMP domain-containing protein
MSIRLKIVLIVVPLLVTTLFLTGVSSYFAATSGITRVAKDFLGFKVEELQKQAESQWSLLVQNNLTGNSEMVAATQAAVQGYASSLLRSPTELILAVREDGTPVMATSEIAWQEGENKAVAARARSRSGELFTLPIAGRERVARGFWFEPFHWYLVVSEERAAFYNQVNEIAYRTAVILAAAIAAGVLLVLLFAGYLTRPIRRVVGTMKEIISTNDLTKRVAVEYRDEIGQLARTFNLLIERLEEAYRQIKGFAFKAVTAQRQEKRTQILFGKFVPEHVIHQFFINPEDTLVGENRVMAVLFSDIRSFTTISEGMRPDELVHSLNRYFDRMVAVVMDRGGTVDKYIGDAIKAFFGAQAAQEENFAMKSVLAGIEMTEALPRFNLEQRAAGKPEFRIGIGLNYGMVTVGNMGTEKKKEYTVIGPMVDLAEHFEGLTKEYHCPLIISEGLSRKVKDELPCRLLDSVPVAGGKPTRIYTVRRALEPAEKEAWGLHNSGMAEYYARNFSQAVRHFRAALDILPEDTAATKLLERSKEYVKNPPPSEWDGTMIGTAS